MPPIPATDWYIVIPVRGNPDPDGFYGAAQSFIVNTNDMDVAAQVAHDHGYARCVVVLGTHYHDPTIPDPPPYP